MMQGNERGMRVWFDDRKRVNEHMKDRGIKKYEMSLVPRLNDKLHEKSKPYVFGVTTGSLPHTIVPEGGVEVGTPMNKLVDLFPLLAYYLDESMKGTN